MSRYYARCLAHGLFSLFYEPRSYKKPECDAAPRQSLKNPDREKGETITVTNMRPNVLIAILFAFGIILSSWCPENAMALPDADPRKIVYIITHRPKKKKKKHRVITITRKPTRITEIYLRR